jgi:penicillin-binding protein 1A
VKIFTGGKKPRVDPFNHRKRWARRLGLILAGLLVLVLLTGAGAGGFIYYRYIKDLPDFTSIREYRPSTVSRIYARDGRLMGELYAERRIEVPYSRLPRHLVLAFVAAEDARFFEHPGVDVFGIIRAFVRNLEAGEIVQGGSTITQQVVKRIILTSEKSFARKVREAVLAYQIDNYLTKEDILEIYLNNIFLGHGAYGVEAAAQGYFGKPVEALTLAEAALLAGIPKAPSRYSPILNPRHATNRQAYVLRRMADVGFISRQEAQQALNQPLVIRPNRPGWLPECGYFTEHVRGMLEERFGRDQVRNLGLRVYTTADVNQHRAAQTSVQEGINALVKRNAYRGPSRRLQGKEIKAYQERRVQYFERYPPRQGQLVSALVTGVDRQRRGIQIKLGYHTGVLTPPDKAERLVSLTYASLRSGDVVKVRLGEQDRETKIWQAGLEAASTVQGALVSMELESGKVRVLMGGKNFRDSSFNRATQALRQPGSAFKPIIYAAAVERGYGPNSILYDEPLSLPGGRVGQLWSPRNYDHTFSGPITMATAIARSRNVPAVRMMMTLGVPAVVHMAKTLGISSPIYPNYASALGASEVTLMDLTRAYSVFPNQGRLVEPVFIERIEDRDGRLLWEHRPLKTQVISPEGANTMTKLLIGVVERGTATRVRVLNRPIGGKTGTTNRTRDAWFIGFTPSLITGAWVGMDDERSLGPKETGSQAAAPIFISFMREALKNQPVEQFPIMPVRTQMAAEPGPGAHYDDEAAVEDELYYPEEKPSLSEVSPGAPSSIQQFFKQDLGG